MTFGDWPEHIHDTPDQQKRLKYGKSSKTTPSSIDKENNTGIFPSSSGGTYTTSLDECTCFDFSQRKLPCKHIYRLAIELGLIEDFAKNGINKNLEFSLRDAVELLEKMSEESQIFIKDFLYASLYHSEDMRPVFSTSATEDLASCPLLVHVDAPNIALRIYKRNELVAILSEKGISGFKKNLSLEKTIDWCISNIADFKAVFPDIAVYKFSDYFYTARRRTYSYLLRKYDWEILYDENMSRMKYPHGAKFGGIGFELTIHSDGTTSLSQNGEPNICYFPDDEITKLLTLHNCNRCLNGFAPIPD